jgi:hypothetical protein
VLSVEIASTMFTGRFRRNTVSLYLVQYIPGAMS